jgi:hypothetical protein
LLPRVQRLQKAAERMLDVTPGPTAMPSGETVGRVITSKSEKQPVSIREAVLNAAASESSACSQVCECKLHKDRRQQFPEIYAIPLQSATEDSKQSRRGRPRDSWAESPPSPQTSLVGYQTSSPPSGSIQLIYVNSSEGTTLLLIMTQASWLILTDRLQKKNPWKFFVARTNLGKE